MASSIVVCSTGLSGSERRLLEETIDALGASYTGDLTDRTTHLVVRPPLHGQASEKLRVAAQLGIPIVTASWISDAAKSGLLELPKAHHLLSADVKPSPAPPGPAMTVGVTPDTVAEPACDFVDDPLTLLREATAGGKLALEIPTGGSATLCGRAHALDTPTGFVRQQLAHGLDRTPKGLAAGKRAYTLREMMFCLRCGGLSHADYFLACVNQGVEPVLLLDKKALISGVVDRWRLQAAVEDESGTARLFEAPLSRATASAIDPRAVVA